MESFGENVEKLPIIITDKAKNMALKACLSDGNESFLRISVMGGGCAGVKYNLDIDEEIGKYDLVCRHDDLKIVCDIFSIQYLNGAKIDYEETLDGAGFRFENPNARKTCGCGSSFS